jgi:hypothetical protein
MTRISLTDKGNKALVADDARRFITPKMAAQRTCLTRHDIHDAIDRDSVSWTFDRYGNLGVDVEDIKRLARTKKARRTSASAV